VTAYALIRLQDRGSFFVEPTQETYEGQVVGENPRGEDMDVNVVREKQQTNMRSSTADTFEALVPPRRLTLEDAWAWSRFARTVLGTNDIDQRVRSHSQEEDSFLAARVADYLVAMKEGSIVAQGEAGTVLTRPNLDEIFGLKAEVADPFNDGSVVVVPHPRGASIPE